jgi:hypothetical protein
MLGMMVEDMIFKGDAAVAMSIEKRHNLLDEKFITKEDVIKIIDEEYDDHDIIENSLFTKD